MSVSNLIVSTFNQSFNKYLFQELVAGKLAHTEFKNGVKKGDEVNIIMPGSVTLSDYDGSQLNQAEEADTSIAKVLINKGKSVHFKINDLKKTQIENAPNLEQKVALAKEFSMDAVKQFASVVDKAYCNLYSRAGYVLDGADASALTMDTTKAKQLFALMKSKFERGDGKGHTSWVDGKMIAIIPPELSFYLTQMDDMKYSEKGMGIVEKGFWGHISGWKILVSNNVANPAENTYMPIFGVEGKTLAGGVSKDLSIKSYIPELGFDETYKGYGLYGCGAPRADYLGTAKVLCNPALS